MPTSLPQKFKAFFWDIEPEKLDFKKNEDYVIGRLLEWGDFDALKWVKDNYGKEKMITALKNSRIISLKTANFYSNIFNIPRKEFRCFQIHSSLKMPWLSRN